MSLRKVLPADLKPNDRVYVVPSSGNPFHAYVVEDPADGTRVLYQWEYVPNAMDLYKVGWREGFDDGVAAQTAKERT